MFLQQQKKTLKIGILNIYIYLLYVLSEYQHIVIMYTALYKYIIHQYNISSHHHHHYHHNRLKLDINVCVCVCTCVSSREGNTVSLCNGSLCAHTPLCRSCRGVRPGASSRGWTCRPRWAPPPPHPSAASVAPAAPEPSSPTGKHSVTDTPF